MDLNQEQREAVETLDGPVLVIAGPGTGKTELLSVRAANIMRKKNIPGENILILTYTNAAAKSVKERLAKVIGFDGYKISADTFHGFANSVILDSEEASYYIRERIEMSDLEKIKCFEYIVDRFPEHVKVLRPFGRPYLYIPDIARKISELKNEGITPPEFEKVVENTEPDGLYVEKKHLSRLVELSFIYKKYEELKDGGDKNIFDERGRYDYDDMIMLALEILAKEPALKTGYHERYKYIMVDEFQDTNGSQLKFLFELSKSECPNLLSVGDDDQSIYRFQGASIANFRIFKEKFPDTKVINLKKNYRSTKEIIELSSSIIKQIPRKERLEESRALIPQKDYKKKGVEFIKFSTEDEETMYLIEKIKEIKKTIENSQELTKEERSKPYNQIAVLVRKRSSILGLIENFLEKGIPYATDGKEDISAHKRVRQMIDALTLAAIPTSDPDEKDAALFRVLSCDFFEIPKSDILRFINSANKKRKERSSSLFEEFIAAFPIENPDKKPIRAEARKMHAASWAIHRLLRDPDTRPLHDILMGFVEDANLYKFIIKKCGSDEILITRELRSLTAFINMVKDIALSRPGITLTEFLDELETMKTHRMPIQGKLVTATQDGVRIITAHASKGLEFQACFIPFCIQDKNWPLKPYPDRIPLPPGILKRREKLESKSELGRLSFFDETRLFYVASSRAKSNLIFTSGPTGDNVTSSFFDNIGVDFKENLAGENEILKKFFERKKQETLSKDTADILRDMVKNLIITPTKLNKFLRCKRQFLYDSILMLPGKKNQSLVFGNCAHKALEDTYRKYKNEKKFPEFDFFREKFLRELRFQGVNKTIADSCLVKLDELKKWFYRIRENPVIPLDLEKKKLITLKGGIIFGGKYDKIELEDEEKKLIRVIDYKTGKPDGHIKTIENVKELMSEECDDYLRQLVAYKMLCERDSPEPKGYKVSHGVLVFLEPAEKTSPKYCLKKGDYVDRKIAVTDEMVTELEGIIFKVWESLNNLEFDKLAERSNEKCGRCAFDSICWEG